MTYLILAIFCALILAFFGIIALAYNKHVKKWQASEKGQTELKKAKRLYFENPDLVVYPAGHDKATAILAWGILISLLLSLLFLALHIFA